MMIFKHMSAIMGAILILAGIAQIFYQTRKMTADGLATRGAQGTNIGLITWKMTSTYPGIGMIAMGTFLFTIEAVVNIFAGP